MQGSTDALVTTGGWHHVMISFDMNNIALRHFYIDGADADNSTTTYTIGQILALNRNSLFIGGDDGFGSDFNGCLAELWVDDTYIDLSVSANRDKFYLAGAPVDLRRGCDSNRQPAGSLHEIC